MFRCCYAFFALSTLGVAVRRRREHDIHAAGSILTSNLSIAEPILDILFKPSPLVGHSKTFKTTAMTWNLLAQGATGWQWEEHRHGYQEQVQIYESVLRKERSKLSTLSRREKRSLKDARQFRINQEGNAPYISTWGSMESDVQAEIRHRMIVSEITRQRPGILLLQEVDGNIFEQLEKVGYRGELCVVSKKPHNPSRKAFGTAVMFDPAVFDAEASTIFAVPPSCGRNGGTQINNRYGRKTGNVVRLQPIDKSMPAIVVANMHLRGLRRLPSIERMKATTESASRISLANDAMEIAARLCFGSKLNKSVKLCGGILVGGDLNSIVGSEWNQFLLDNTQLASYDFVGVADVPTTWAFDYSISHNSAAIDQLYFKCKGAGVSAVKGSAAAGNLTGRHEDKRALEENGVPVGVWNTLDGSGTPMMGSDHTWVTTELRFQSVEKPKQLTS